MFNVVLHQPEIPPNTGNIIRLCANTGCNLHLIEPLGFSLDEKQTRRAGLDYQEMTSVETWESWKSFDENNVGRILSFSTKNTIAYSNFEYQKGDVLLFGSETKGLPSEVFDSIPESRRLHIPMVSGSRSLNLSNSVALVVYEAWRQQGFANAQLS